MNEQTSESQKPKLTNRENEEITYNSEGNLKENTSKSGNTLGSFFKTLLRLKKSEELIK